MKNVTNLKKITSRNFTVDYFQKEEEIWVVNSHLEDEEHDIEAFVEIDMVEKVVLDAEIIFHSCPMDYCKLIEDKAHQMGGIKVDKEFTRNVMKIFMGPEGCPNIMSLLNISVPGIIYYYYPYKIKTGKMDDKQWDNMIRTELKNDCLAHTRLNGD